MIYIGYIFTGIWRYILPKGNIDGYLFQAENCLYVYIVNILKLSINHYKHSLVLNARFLFLMCYVF